MPYYVWRPIKEPTADRDIQVMRSFDNYQDPPTADEGAEDGVEYERVITTAPKVTKADGFGQKGNWILATLIYPLWDYISWSL